MNYPQCWDTARVREVFTTESRQKSRELFLATHQPFHHIRVDFSKDTVSLPFVDEGQLRGIVQGGHLTDHNRLFFVVGEAGSGKSELCQWLEYTADERAHIPIHIPRRMTNAVHVVALLRQKLNGDQDGHSLRNVPLAVQVEHLALSATLLLYERARGMLDPVDRWAQLLASPTLRRMLAVSIRQVEVGRRSHRDLISEAQLRRLCNEYHLEVTRAQRAETHLAFSWLLSLAFEQSLWLGDLAALLADISDRTIRGGRRPLLLIEDITAFQILGDRLLDYLLDLTSGHFDAVIGVTTGFEQTQLVGATLAGDLTHIHHRLRARFVLTDERGRAYGLEENLVEFVRTYLRAIRPDCAICPLQLACETAFGQGLYPFTETALARAFGALHEDGNPRQTPRLLLEHVLRAVLLADEIPSLTLDRSAYLRRPPAVFRADDVDGPSLQSVLRWYGTIGEAEVTLDAGIPRHWQIAVDPRLIRDDLIRVPRTFVAAPGKVATASQDWQQALREFETWIGQGGLYPNRETLKRGIERTLLNLGDPRGLGNRRCLSLSKAEMYYARGDERLPISLGRDSGDQSSTGTYVKVVIEGKPEERGILEEMVYLGLTTVELSEVSRNLALTLDWAQRHWDNYHSHIRGVVAEHLGGIDLDHIVWVAWHMLWPLWRPEPEVGLPNVPPPDAAVGYNALSPWSPREQPQCYTTGEMVFGWHDVIRRLFIGSFMLRDSLQDRPRVLAVQSEVELMPLVVNLARLALRPLRSLPIKFRPVGHSLYELLVPLQRYAQALVRLDVAECMRQDLADLARREAHLRGQVGLDTEKLTQQLATLRWRCGELGIAWRERWDISLGALRDFRPEVGQTLRGALQETGSRYRGIQPADFTVWQYQAFRHAVNGVLRHPYWQGTTDLAAIEKELVAAARQRYRQTGRQLSNTPAYRKLLRQVRAVVAEVRDEHDANH